MTLPERVAEAARISVPLGRKKLRARIAKQLAMSPRTLARRLADEGTSVKRICDQVRFDLAVELLAAGEPIGGVAYDIGYSDSSSLSHAMKRWTGESASKAMGRAA